ncbi:D-3-phosphoglycerate dehydrogenase [Phyllosticta paracitricarpa]|uniref:D-3-phosphoglycerate dehydrogenase n=2 Tax=Phyllosticta TaxID=121621 RepID=A0ABR1MNS0_9PEZI
MVPDLYQSQKPRVLYLGEPKHSSRGIEENSKDFDIDIIHAADRKELMRKLPAMVAAHGPYQAAVCRLSPQPYEPFDEELLAPLLPHLRIVVSAQSGFNDFDVGWMTKAGIWFCNSRYATSEATADMTFFLLLAILRDTSRAEQNFRQGHWRKQLDLSQDPADLTLGIVGMGNIGRKVARKAAAFNMNIRYYNRRRLPNEEARYGAQYCATVEELLQSADVVTIHCPLTPETTHLISTKQFAMMKQGSYIINTARGPIIDGQALIEALESGKIARAGLDVFPGEPTGIHPYFLESDKVVVQPHMGGLTKGSFAKAEKECFTNITSYFRTGRPYAPVNDVLPRRDSFEPEEHEAF